MKLTTYARAVLGEAFEDLAEPAERPNRLGPPVVVPCMGCLGRGVRLPIAACTCWDDYLTAAVADLTRREWPLRSRPHQPAPRNPSPQEPKP